MKKNLFLFLVLLPFLAGCGSDETLTVSANAGDDQEALLGDTVNLDGAASTGILKAAWTFDSRPTGSTVNFSESGSLTPTFVPDVSGTYVARLTLNDGAAADTLTIKAKSILATITVPSESAIGTRQRFNSTEYVVTLQQPALILSAENSRGAISTYTWEQVSGPGATTTNGTAKSTLQFNAPSLTDFLNAADQYKWQVLPVSREDTKMVFKLTVQDSQGNSDAITFPVYVQDQNDVIHTSSGLPNVGLNTTVTLSGPNLKAVSGANSTAITDWLWTLTAPGGSRTVFQDSATSSSTLQFPKFIPDTSGFYTVAYQSSSGGTSGTLRINVAEWSGIGTIGGTTAASPQCGACHNGTVSSDKVNGWSQTKHASLFENAMSIYAGLAPEPYLWESHTVGYNTDATNHGFDDLAATSGFTFPASGMTFAEFTSAYPDPAKLANVQCENCHGPGSEHKGDITKISDSSSQFGVCGQCHLQEAEWINSAHNSTGVVHGSGAYQASWLGASCSRCHTGRGFASYVDNGDSGKVAVTESGAFPGITCAACHDPHASSKEHQLRLTGNIVMIIDGSTVDAGKAAVCYKCHDGNYSYHQTSCDSNSDGNADASCTTTDQTATQSVRQVHYNPQAPVLEGKGGLTDLNGDGANDFTLTENSFHGGASFNLAGVTGDSSLSKDNNKCVTCHMSAGPAIDEEAYRHVGGHSFKLRVGHGIGHLHGEETGEGDEAASSSDTELVSACTSCHSTLTTFNRTAPADYDGDGTVEGIQDEVHGLLLALSNKIKGLDTTRIKSTSGTVVSAAGAITPDVISFNGACSNFTATGCKATAGTSTCNNRATGKARTAYQQCNFVDLSATLRRAIWNHNLIVRDGSFGIHNVAFTVQLLQKTYTAVGGNSFTTDFNATLR